jgi:hypothetical protein
MLETPLCCESGYPQVICSSPSAICVHSPSRRCGEGPEMPRDIQSQNLKEEEPLNVSYFLRRFLDSTISVPPANVTSVFLQRLCNHNQNRKEERSLGY